MHTVSSNKLTVTVMRKDWDELLDELRWLRILESYCTSKSFEEAQDEYLYGKQEVSNDEDQNR